MSVVKPIEAVKFIGDYYCLGNRSKRPANYWDSFQYWKPEPGRPKRLGDDRNVIAYHAWLAERKRHM